MGLMDYFRPSPTRKSASGADLVSARQAIVYLAKHAESQDIRQAALSHIRTNLSDEKKYAIEHQLKSLDQGTRLIGEAALSKFDPTECIQDQTFLFDVAKNASSKKDRHKAICQLTNQLDLVDITISATDMKELHKDGAIALSRIEDQDLLFKVACEAKVDDVSQKAIDRIKDQKTIRRLAKKSSFYVARRLATKRLTDRKMLIKIALNDQSPFVRRAALQRLDAEAILKKAARKDNDAKNRKYALEKIDDQQILIEIARYDSDKEVRLAAIKKIEDKTFLSQIAKAESDWDIREAAANKLADEALINKIAYEKKAKKKKHKDQVIGYARFFFNNLPIIDKSTRTTDDRLQHGTLSDVVMMLDDLGIFVKSVAEDPKEAWRNISPGNRDSYCEMDVDYAWFVLNARHYMDKGWLYDEIDRIIIERIGDDEFLWFQETITRDSN